MRRFKRRPWRCGLMLLVAIPTAMLAGGPRQTSYERLVIGVRPDADHGAVAAALTRSGADPVEYVPETGLLVADVPARRHAELAGRLRSLEVVRYVAPSTRHFRPAAVPADPLYTERQRWSIDRIEAPRAWDLLPPGGDTLVAVLDTGIDVSHPEFAGRISPPRAAPFIISASAPLAARPRTGTATAPTWPASLARTPTTVPASPR